MRMISDTGRILQDGLEETKVLFAQERGKGNRFSAVEN